MQGIIPARLAKFAAAFFAASALVAVAAGTASAATSTPYTTDYTSAYGSVHCVGTLRVSKAHPGNATEGGREVERCTSTEPNGKLTGYFTPGETYTGYWESDYYATIGKPGVQPSSVTIKVAKNFKWFIVRAVYAFAG
jgi:hypothetical protein